MGRKAWLLLALGLLALHGLLRVATDAERWPMCEGLGATPECERAMRLQDWRLALMGLAAGCLLSAVVCFVAALVPPARGGRWWADPRVVGALLLLAPVWWAIGQYAAAGAYQLVIGDGYGHSIYDRPLLTFGMQVGETARYMAILALLLVAFNRYERARPRGCPQRSFS